MHGSLKGIKIRLFFTCWLIFVLHFATDFSREHYLVLSIVDDFSFRLNKYVGLHNDIFMTRDYGAHHGANPGASMIAAVPYLVFKPFIAGVVNHVKEKRQSANEGAPVYTDDRPARAKFYKQVYEKGLDIKFGLVGFVTMVFCMAPLSALGAVVMFSTITYLGLSNRLSLGMSLLYALGTPVFFRTAYLNQNLMVGIFGFSAFSLLWQMKEKNRLEIWQRFGIAGFLGGLSLLCDYSGVIVLFMLGGYGLLRRMDSASIWESLKDSLWYVGGAIGPIALLWFYQWRSFGYPFYPPQHFMPLQTYSDVGYQGVTGPSAELFWMLLFNWQFGLFIASPILLLAFFSPILTYFKKNVVPLRETLFILAFFIVFILFFSGVQFTKLQWITGIRYVIPVVPFIFLLMTAVMVRLPRIVAFGLSILAFSESWVMSMLRRVDFPNEGIMSNIIRFFMEGFQLPWLNTLSRAATLYAPFLDERTISPFPFFLLWGVLIYGIWRIKLPWDSLGENNV